MVLLGQMSGVSENVCLWLFALALAMTLLFSAPSRVLRANTGTLRLISASGEVPDVVRFFAESCRRKKFFTALSS